MGAKTGSTGMNYRLIRTGQGLLINQPNSSVFSLRLNFKAGSSLVPDIKNKPQVAHLLEHVIMAQPVECGSSEQFVRLFSKYGAKRNAYTSPINTTYYVCSPISDWRRTINLALAQITRPNFTDRIYRREIGNVTSELKGNLSTSGTVLGSEIEHAMGLPCATTNQSLDTLNSISLADLSDFWQSAYGLNGMSYIATGSFDGTNAVQLEGVINEAVDRLGQSSNFSVPNIKAESLRTPVVIARSGIPSITWRINFVMPMPTTRQRLLQLVILRNILAGNMGGRLYGRVRSEGLAYGVHIKLMHSYESVLQFAIYGRAASDKLERLLGIVMHELQSIADGDISDSEISLACEFITGRRQINLQTADQLAEWMSASFFRNGDVATVSGDDKAMSQISANDIAEAANYLLAKAAIGSGFYGDISHDQADRLNSLTR